MQNKVQGYFQEELIQKQKAIKTKREHPTQKQNSHLKKQRCFTLVVFYVNMFFWRKKRKLVYSHFIG